MCTQGVSDLRSLQSESASRPLYSLPNSLNDIQEALAKVATDELLEELRASGTFGLIVDESTDRSTDKTLIIYVKYHCGGVSKTKFLCVAELESANADGIVNCIRSCLVQHNIDITKCVAFASDGASVMMGCTNGVVAKLRTICPMIAAVHCVAHRLQLAVVHASHSIDYLKEFQGVVNSIYKYYHCSAKRLGNLNKIREVFEIANRKFKEVFDVRWLSFQGAVDAVLHNIEPLVHALNEDKQQPGNAAAQGLLKYITTFDFLATTHMMADVLGHIGRLSRTFQTKNLDFFHSNLSLNACVAALSEMKTKPGPMLQQFFDTLPTENDSLPPNSRSFTWRGIEIQFGKRGGYSWFNNMMTKFLVQLCQNLEMRFPNSDTMAAFSVLNPKMLPSSVSEDSHETEWLDYGTDSIETLGRQIEELFSAFPQDTPLKLEGLKQEWIEVKNIMKKSFSTMSICDFIQKFLTLDIEDAYPNFLALANLYLCIPISSVDCERGFSTYNIIKSYLRNRLHVSTVNTLMQMSVETPPLPDLHKFNFEKAFEHWCGMKSRKTHRLINE